MDGQKSENIMVRRYRSGFVTGLFVITALLAPAAAQEFADTIVKRGAAIEQDLYLAGRTIDVAAEVRGDLIAAGQQVSVTRPVSEDVVVAGEIVSLRGPVADDVRAVGRLVTLAAPIRDHVVAAGETVTLSADASTGSWAWLAGRRVKILGEVGGELKAAGQEIVIGGTVRGDVRLYAERIHILETGHIQGRFEYASEHALEIADGAAIDGEITRLELPDLARETENWLGAAVGIFFVLFLALLLVGIVYLLVFSGVAAEAARKGTRQPWAALGLGLAILFVVPFLVIILMATVFGLLLALAVLALYVVVLLVGYVNGVAWLTDLILRRRDKETPPRRRTQLLTFALMLVILMVVQLVPLIGQLVGLVIWSIGIGGLVLGLVTRYRAATVAAD